jgi:hypothetical protein
VVLESRVNGITGEPGKLRKIVWEKIAIGTPFHKENNMQYKIFLTK